jgi:arabinogalactan endo-1,4-beta-galactosidase
MGADITWVQHDEAYGATYVDTDGVTKDILALLKNHGFNSIRLRSYVDPRAADGYDQVDGFGDLAHTVAMAQRVKNAGMGLLISFHLSDNWADPGKQCIPVAWQGSTLAQLAAHVHDYMFGAITALKNAGATPDLVQIGNEITPGLLIHICDSAGMRVSTSSVNGSTSNWANTGTLLKEGIRGVKEVDANIKTVLHIDKGGDATTSVSWIRNAQNQNVQFDVFADTAYVRWQGQPSGWQNTFNTLVSTFPNLSFIIPEYANETATSPATPSTMRLANDIVFNIASNRGLGAWIYEPAHPVQAGVGVGLFVNNTSGSTLADAWPSFVAASAPMAVYDQMRTAYANRL